MSYASLLSELQAADAAVYDRAAPRGLTRYAVLHPYPGSFVRGDDRNLLPLRKAQLDLYTQQPGDSLGPTLCAVLDGLSIPYDVIEDELYDDELALFRTILQMEVLES